MRVRDFVADLSNILHNVPKNDSTLNLDIEELKFLCWGGADSMLPATKANLTPFYDFLMKRSINKQSNVVTEYTVQVDQVCEKMRMLFEQYLQPPVHDFSSMIAEMLKLPSHQRVDFLADFNIAKLSKVILSGKDFKTIVNDKENYVGDVDHARTVLMALGYYYHELIRTRASDYKHSSWTGYDKAIKLKGIHLVLKFLESGERLSKFADYLESDMFKEVVAKSTFSSKEYTLKDAVLQGELGDLCSMITYASKPENREPVKPSKSWLGW